MPIYIYNTLETEGWSVKKGCYSLISGLSEGLKIRGCQYYLVGIICQPLVEIGLIDLPKSGVAMAPPGTTGLGINY